MQSEIYKQNFSYTNCMNKSRFWYINTNERKHYKIQFSNRYFFFFVLLEYLNVFCIISILVCLPIMHSDWNGKRTTIYSIKAIAAKANCFINYYLPANWSNLFSIHWHVQWWKYPKNLNNVLLSIEYITIEKFNHQCRFESFFFTFFEYSWTTSNYNDKYTRCIYVSPSPVENNCVF